MAAAIDSARRRGVGHLTATTFATNEAMRRLGLHAGPPVHFQPADIGVARLDWDLAA